MQRLFSSFPDGRPGAGLLVLRFAAAIAMIAEARAWLGASEAAPWRMALASIAIAAAATLLAGYMTPFAGCVAAAASLLGPAPYPFVIAIAAAIVLLGPGAFSVDARLFGRREIVVGHQRG